MFLIIFVCLSANALWYSSSLSVLISILFIIGMIPLVGQINSSVAGLGSPGPSGIIFICNKARCKLELSVMTFLSVCFTSLIHAPPGHCFDGGTMMILCILY